LVLKLPVFLYPQKPLQDDGDNYIYKAILNFLGPLNNTPAIFSLIAFVLLFIQATLLNRISNSIKLFPRPNYLVAMSYILLTSLMQEWSYFSAPLIVNTLLIWIWYRLIGLYNSNTPKTAIYNVGVLIGILPLIYSPAIAFVILLALALVITRPLHITEWIVGLLGLITPYYFLIGILFLLDQLQFSKVIPTVSFYIPQLPASLWITGGIILLVLPFLFGSYYVQDNLNKMLIHVRKSWSLMLVFLITAMLIIPINYGAYNHWMLLTVPLAAFHGAAYFFMPSRAASLIFHWLTFIYIILLNYYSFNPAN
jgi:hypothetical protein